MGASSSVPRHLMAVQTPDDGIIITPEVAERLETARLQQQQEKLREAGKRARPYDVNAISEKQQKIEVNKTQ